MDKVFIKASIVTFESIFNHSTQADYALLKLLTESHYCFDTFNVGLLVETVIPLVYLS